MSKHTPKKYLSLVLTDDSVSGSNKQNKHLPETIKKHIFSTMLKINGVISSSGANWRNAQRRVYIANSYPVLFVGK